MFDSQPKTIKGLFSFLKKIETLEYRLVRDFDKLPESLQVQLINLGAQISNIVNEFEEL